MTAPNDDALPRDGDHYYCDRCGFEHSGTCEAAEASWRRRRRREKLRRLMDTPIAELKRDGK
jgi:hypothetical protein